MVVKTIRPHFDNVKRETGSVYQVTQKKGNDLIRMGLVVEQKPSFKNLTKKNARRSKQRGNNTK